MKTKLDQYIEQMKQECSAELLDYKETRQLISEYESQEKHLTTYTMEAVSTIDQIQQKIPKYVRRKSTNYFADRINEAFIQFIIGELNITHMQMQNRYNRELNLAFEADYLGVLSETFNRHHEFDNDFDLSGHSSENEQNAPANNAFDENYSDDLSFSEEEQNHDDHGFIDNYSTEASSSEEEQKEPDTFDVIHDVCLRFLISLASNKRHFLHQIILSATQYASSIELNAAIATACREHLNQEKTPITTLHSSFSTPQLLVWGMAQEPKDAFDLSDSEVIFIFEDDKWQALATAYLLTKQSTLILSALSLDTISSDAIGSAFSKAGANVNKLVLYNFSHLLYVHTETSRFGEFLRNMNVKTLDLSCNFLYMQTDAEWLKTLGAMLKEGKVKKINLRGNDLYKMSDTLWNTLCECLSDTEIEAVEIDYINDLRLAQLLSVLKKPATPPNSFFHHDKTVLSGSTKYHYQTQSFSFI